jgi:hypothetical protein
MPYDLRLQNKPNKECLYGWFPGGRESPRTDPKDIYINLGSRPPTNKSYVETETILKYHQSMKPSEHIYRVNQSVDEALKPPWSLDYQPQPQTEATQRKTKKNKKLNSSSFILNFFIYLKS